MHTRVTNSVVPVIVAPMLVLVTTLLPLPTAAYPTGSSALRPAGQTAGAVVINEFVASNQSGLQDEDGDHSDWIELYNPGAAPIDLAGWSLSDDAGEPGKWLFPARTLPANGYLVVFASGKNRAPPAGELHSNFRLSAAGEYLGLFDSSSPRQVIDQFTPQFPAQYADVSYGRYNAPAEYRYFSHATPGATNDFASAYLGVVADVSFQYPRGYYDNGSFTVALETSTSGAVIKHTRSGYPPSATVGSLYDGPVNIYDSLPLRAVAVKSGYISSHVGTNTYIMPSHVMRQPADPSGYPPTWGTFNGEPVPADYEMDPRVVDDPRYNAHFVQDLRALPAISVVTSRNDLFDPYTGIYSNPLSTGDYWERNASVELIYADGRTGFQIDAGLRLHGGTTRRPDATPKHSLRLHFRPDYGTPKLEYPLYDDSSVESFDVLILRAGHSDNWLYSSRALYVRDQWLRDTQAAMGSPVSHGRYVHLYLNGLYWGVYSLLERLDDHYAASYFGGSEEDYDIVEPHVPDGIGAVHGDLEAWNTLMTIADGGLNDPGRYVAIQEYLDVPNLIDYMITHIYAGTYGDWLGDWRAMRKREPGAGFMFFSWDNEFTLQYPELDNTMVGIDRRNTPTYLNYQLSANAEYRMLFADHVHRHFFNGGLLFVDPANPVWDPDHPDRNVPAARFVNRAEQVRDALVAESARWGDANFGYYIYTRDDHWQPKLDWILTEFFPQRSAIVLQQLRNAGLYPTVDAPAFSQHGGSVPSGFPLAMTAPTGAIYFTTDGSDPRIPVSGAVSPSAMAYAAPFPLPGGVTTVKARTLDGNTWSALNEATFEAPQDWSTLKLTEIMYNPLGGSAYEFLELKNIGSSTLNLAGVQLADGVDFVFPAGSTLAPGHFNVLSNDDDPIAFASRYPGVPVAGLFTRELSNGGDTVTLLDPLGSTILSVTYDDVPPWPTAPDGLGYSLVIVDPLAAPNDPANWRASSAIHGSPAANDPPPTFAGIVINELLAHSDPPFEDAIELHNQTNAPVNIGGWFLSDDANAPTKFRIPDGTTIAPGGFLVFYEYQFNPTPGLPPSFALSSTGERLFLFAADPGGALTGYADSVQFDASPTNTAIGHFSTSSGVRFTTLSRSTFGVDSPATVQQFRTGTGAPNAYPLVGPLVIHELMYNPATGGTEFIELRNITNAPLPLYDPAVPANTWRFTNGIEFDFPPNAVIPPHSLALVTPIDPALFAATYNVPAGVPLFGPYTGALDNGGETVTLSRPDAPNGGDVPYTPVDSLTYDDVAPWPTQPDGSGPSLERLSGPTYADDPALWAASTPGGTPGRPNDACFHADVQPNKDHTQPALCDGDVDIADLQTVAACWNRPLAAANCPATLNIDGTGAYFTINDIIASAGSWGWRQ